MKPTVPIHHLLRSPCRAALLLALVLSAAMAVAETGRVTVRRSVIKPILFQANPYSTFPFEVDDSDCVRCRSARHPKTHVPIPVDPRVDPSLLGPIGPPTTVSGDMRTGAGGTKAPGDFVFFGSHDFSPTFFGTAEYGYVMEPSFDTDGRAVFWTGNSHAAYSEDYGQSFTLINTFDNFPADGNNDLVMGGVFCCDQDVVYDRTRGAWFWLMLYHVAECDSINVQRLAVAPTTEAMLNNQWNLYDFSPLNFGHVYEHGMWLDFPHLTLGDNYLYHVTKMLKYGVIDTCYAKTGGGGDAESATTEKDFDTNHLIAKYPLDDLVQGLPITIDWWTTNETHGMRGCAGATGSIMYFGSHLSTGTLRVFMWPEISPYVSYADVAHNGWDPAWPFQATGPDGLNWAGRMDNYIQGAWASGGELGFMFAATTGGGFTYPAVHIVRVAQSDRRLMGHHMVWNPDHGFAFPNVHPNDRSHVAGVMAFGGGDLHPNMLAWIADDYNGYTFQPLETYQFTYGDQGPDDVWWGDYFTARRNVPYGNTWGGSGVCLIGGSRHRDAHGYYVRFGRERDAPPAHHTIHVNWSNTSGWEDGSAAHPYDTVTEGHFAAVDGDTIIVQAGSYPEAVVLSTEVHVKSAGGIAVIGP